MEIYLENIEMKMNNKRQRNRIIKDVEFQKHIEDKKKNIETINSEIQKNYIKKLKMIDDKAEFYNKKKSDLMVKPTKLLDIEDKTTIFVYAYKVYSNKRTPKYIMNTNKGNYYTNEQLEIEIEKKISDQHRTDGIIGFS